MSYLIAPLWLTADGIDRLLNSDPEKNAACAEQLGV
jgi:hypothetical protein